MSVLFTTVYSGIALNTDRTKGVVDRFRSLPAWRSAPLVGSLLGDAVRYLIAGTVILLLGLALGFRPEAGVSGVLARSRARRRLLVRAVLGLHDARPDPAHAQRRDERRVMGIFPLTFLSNVFVDPATLPGPLRAFVEVNSISLLATSSRGLMQGTADAREILVVLLVAVVLTAVFAPLTTRLYARS